MRLLRQLIYKNSLIQVYEGERGTHFGGQRVFLDRVEVTDYAYVDGGAAECVKRAKEIIDHYSRQFPIHAENASAALPVR